MSGRQKNPTPASATVKIDPNNLVNLIKEQSDTLLKLSHKEFQDLLLYFFKLFLNEEHKKLLEENKPLCWRIFTDTLVYLKTQKKNYGLNSKFIAAFLEFLIKEFYKLDLSKELSNAVKQQCVFILQCYECLMKDAERGDEAATAALLENATLFCKTIERNYQHIYAVFIEYCQQKGIKKIYLNELLKNYNLPVEVWAAFLERTSVAFFNPNLSPQDQVEFLAKLWADSKGEQKIQEAILDKYAAEENITSNKLMLMPSYLAIIRRFHFLIKIKNYEEIVENINTPEEAACLRYLFSDKKWKIFLDTFEYSEEKKTMLAQTENVYARAWNYISKTASRKITVAAATDQYWTLMITVLLEYADFETVVWLMNQPALKNYSYPSSDKFNLLVEKFFISSLRNGLNFSNYNTFGLFLAENLDNLMLTADQTTKFDADLNNTFLFLSKSTGPYFQKMLKKHDFTWLFQKFYFGKEVAAIESLLANPVAQRFIKEALYGLLQNNRIGLMLSRDLPNYTSIEAVEFFKDGCLKELFIATGGGVLDTGAYVKIQQKFRSFDRENLDTIIGLDSKASLLCKDSENTTNFLMGWLIYGFNAIEKTEKNFKNFLVQLDKYLTAIRKSTYRCSIKKSLGKVFFSISNTPSNKSPGNSISLLEAMLDEDFLFIIMQRPKDPNKLSVATATLSLFVKIRLYELSGELLNCATTCVALTKLPLTGFDALLKSGARKILFEKIIDAQVMPVRLDDQLSFVVPNNEEKGSFTAAMRSLEFAADIPIDFLIEQTTLISYLNGANDIDGRILNLSYENFKKIWDYYEGIEQVNSIYTLFQLPGFINEKDLQALDYKELCNLEDLLKKLGLANENPRLTLIRALRFQYVERLEKKIIEQEKQLQKLKPPAKPSSVAANPQSITENPYLGQVYSAKKVDVVECDLGNPNQLLTPDPK